MLARTASAVAMVALLASLLLLSGCSHPPRAGTGSMRVTMADCGGSPQAEPTVVNLICQTNDITARGLIWSAWGKPVATAIGKAVVDLCAFSDCHTGSYQSLPIVVVASKIGRCRKDTHAYSRLQYVFIGGSPFGSLPARMNFSNFMTGASRPGPPRDQTVSLAC